MTKVEWAISPHTELRFSCVFDPKTCLPIEPIQRFLNYCRKRQLAPNTVSTYAYRLVDFWRWLESKSLNWYDVGLNELADFVNWYLLGGEVEESGENVREIVAKRSPRTVNQAVTAIQEFYTYHTIEGRIEEKHFTLLAHGWGKRGGFLRGIAKSNPDKRKRIKIKEPKLFSGCLLDEEVATLANACTTYRDRLIIMLLRSTGVRRGELLGLHLEDVKDLDFSGRIRIVRREDNPNRAMAKGREREIPIIYHRSAIQETFHAYLLEEYPPQAETLGGGMLFVNLSSKWVGQAMSLVRLNKLFDQLHKRTGIKAHPHLFRHTFATRMLQDNYLDQYVQQLLGHRSIATTKDIYSHVLDEMTLDPILKRRRKLMAEAFAPQALQERIALSELGRQWINDPLMNQDVWSLLELGYSQEECRINGHYHLYFHKFSLPWLKRLTQLTIKASIRERYSLGRIIHRVGCLNHLDRFLCKYGYTQPQSLTEALLHQFISEINSGNRQNAIAYALNLWKEEQWLEIAFTPIKLKKKSPKIETIPEEVLYQIYEKFDLFPPTLERLFRLQLVLGCRIGEILTMPRHSLKQEGDKWFLLRWVEKRKHWRFVQIHPLVAELVQEQQRFLDAQFGRDSEFDKLFCTVYTHHQSIPWADRELDTTLFYKPQTITRLRISNWLINFREVADLKDKHGNRFKLTSHMFRRTKASIMAHCEVEDEYIAAVLGHGSLDMLPHYRQRSLIRLEKEANLKGYVDMYGRVTSFKPRKTRYEKLANLLKVSTPLGECHRPTMLGDCQHRYACLSCPHHRITPEDKSQLEADVNCLQQDLIQAQKNGQERRVTEIANLLALIKNRFDGLSELQNLQEQKNHG